MAIVEIPLQAIPAQSVAVTLGAQNCVIALREIGGRQYFSLSSNGVVMCQNVLVQHGVPLVMAAYLGFVGEFAAIDTAGNESPVYSGWGSRWVLLYNDA